jgi:1,2-phenylacetyl-CoA epoxidase PaaB subunit
MERYFVFARTEYDEPLEHRGGVEAEDAEEARKLALEEYGKEWLEMSLVPVGRVYWAEREEETEVGVKA